MSNLFQHKYSVPYTSLSPTRSPVFPIFLPAPINLLKRSSIITPVTGPSVSPTGTEPPIPSSVPSCGVVILSVIRSSLARLGFFEVFKLIVEVYDTVAIFRELETLDWRITNFVPVHILIFSVFCGSTCTGNLLSLYPHTGPTITEQCTARD